MAFLDGRVVLEKSHTCSVVCFRQVGGFNRRIHQAVVSIKLVAGPAGDLLTIDADVCRH